ncbi:MAG: ImmA/IrrE family metallo-endopeptidase [Chloroflexi bacterium]|nr:ImmA/IrrE family metallo-endopeptidase [Chloroflexota bacterium]
MSAPLWVGEAAREFWEAAGGPEPFPRDLRAPLARALPVALVPLPRPRTQDVEGWLRRREVAFSFEAGDCPLRACLVAYNGRGIIFLDGADPPAEQRFSLAHEIAHFLRHYWLPRQEVAARLGPAAIGVLDGERAPTVEERIDALLARTWLGVHVHLLPRGAADLERVIEAEREADLLACELLAPSDQVLAGIAPGPGPARRQAVEARLREEFGLPPGPAARYAARLVPPGPRPGWLLERLGLGGSGRPPA